VLGSRVEITYEDLNELKYTGCVIKETLRLWPPVPHLSRVVEGSYSIDGYDIPEGTWIQVSCLSLNSRYNLKIIKDYLFKISPFTVGRSEKHFHDPLKFQPERFLMDEK